MQASTLELLMMAVTLAGAGLASGVLSGLFGVGGGAILVPILSAAFAVLGTDPAHVAHLAVGTSLGIIVPTTIQSYKAHRSRGMGNTALLKRWRIFVPAGVIVASFIVGFVSGNVLRGVFVVVAVVIAAKMLFLPKGWHLSKDLPSKPVTDGVGFGIGFVSTFMGIGGGNLNNLFMTLFGQPMHQAVATSAGLGPLVAIPGVIGYMISGWGAVGVPPASIGHVNLAALALVAPFAMLAAPLGATLAHKLSARKLEIAFALFLVTVAVRMSMDILA